MSTELVDKNALYFGLFYVSQAGNSGFPIQKTLKKQMTGTPGIIGFRFRIKQ